MSTRTDSATALPRTAVRLLGSALILGFVLQAPRLPIALSILFVVYTLVAAFEYVRAPYAAASRRHRFIGYALLLCASALTYGTYGYLLGREPMLALFPLLAVLKFREMRNVRDYQLLVMIGFFMTATHFIYAQGPYATLMSLPVILMLISAPLLLHAELEPPRLRHALLFSMRLVGVATPFMVLAFLLFPRLPAPLWSILRDPLAAQSGLSASMTPGSISNLSLSDEIVFRVEFRDQIPDKEALYWRGPVFWQLRGETWSAGRAEDKHRQPIVEPLATPLHYTVTLEPSSHQRMFAIDMPAQAATDARLSADMQMLTHKPILARTRYELASYTRYRLYSSGPAELQRALQLPLDRNLRTIALAQSWQAEGLSGPEIIDRALSMFREQGFTYTLQPERVPVDSVDFLLFDSREGFCEHYASALAVLARAVGIPARIVTGYQGGELNHIGGYYTIRQRNAHAWVEIWQHGRGWVRVDPTLYVAPARIRRGLEGLQQIAEALPLQPQHNRLSTLWDFALDGLDAFQNGWNQWVIGYDREQQLQLWSELGGKRTDLAALAGVLALSAAALFLAYLAVALRRRKTAVDPTVRLYRRFTAKLARVGIPNPACQGPLDFAAHAAARTGQREDIYRITELYVRLRYGKGPGSTAQLRRLVKAFKPRTPGSHLPHA